MTEKEKTEFSLRRQLWSIVVILIVGGAGTYGNLGPAKNAEAVATKAQAEATEARFDMIQLVGRVKRLEEIEAGLRIDLVETRKKLADLQERFKVHETKTARFAHGRN